MRGRRALACGVGTGSVTIWHLLTGVQGVHDGNVRRAFGTSLDCLAAMQGEHDAASMRWRLMSISSSGELRDLWHGLIQSGSLHDNMRGPAQGRYVRSASTINSHCLAAMQGEHQAARKEMGNDVSLC